MKRSLLKTVVALSFLAFTLPLIAADSGQINYQARLLDSYGRRVNGTVNLSFKIYDAATDGNLLWSETQSGVTVQDGVYAVILGSQTPIPAAVFANDGVYLELGVNGETLSPRQQMTASSYALVARTIMGSNVYENQTSGNLGVGTTNPVEKLDVNGTVRATGFTMLTGASANYVLVSDSSGVGSWQALSYVLVEHDPIFTNWAQITFAPTTNALNTAIANETAARIAADAGISNAYIAADAGISNAFAAADTVVSNALTTAVGQRVLKAGDVMTGPLTNNVAIYGNGVGLTNIPTSSIVLTGYVQRAGDTLSGALVISNNLTVTLTNEAADVVATNSIALRGSVITNWENLTGTLNTAVGNLNTSTNALNTQVTNNISEIGTLQGNTNALNTAIINETTARDASDAGISNAYIAADTVVSNGLDAKVTAEAAARNASDTGISNAYQAADAGISNTINTRAIMWNNAVICKQGSGTIAYSNLYYLGANTSWSNANATASATAKGMLGLALGSSVADDGLLLNGMFDNVWGFSVGSVIYMDTNANMLATTAPTGTNNVVRVIGYVVSSTNIYFNPDRTYIEVLGE